MAYRCDYCDKKRDIGHNVSHAKNRTRRLRMPNLHSARVLEAGKLVHRTLCTKCLRMADRPGWEPKVKDEKTSEVVAA